MDVFYYNERWDYRVSSKWIIMIVNKINEIFVENKNIIYSQAKTDMDF